MPIWPVSIVDGSAQVADADGALYPITMSGSPVPAFNAGWSARGLQTGLAPFHVLELQHEGGQVAYWMLDTALDFRGNAVATLSGGDRELFFAQAERLVRNLFDDAVSAPHAAVPAAAHEFDGFLPSTVRELIGETIDRVIGRPDAVSLSTLDGLSTSYAGNGVALPTAWLAQALQAPITAGIARLSVPPTLSVPAHDDGPALMSQETLELEGHTGFRFLDRASGLVFYVLVGADDADRHLYVPSAKAAFTRSPAAAAHDPLLLLMVYYATHVGRAVMLPEADGLEPGLVHAAAPPQTGLDEPAAAAPVPPPALVEPIGLSELPPPVAAERPVTEPGGGAVTEPGLGSVQEPVRSPPSMPPPAGRLAGSASRQNWWQRLLGLGNAS